MFLGRVGLHYLLIVFNAQGITRQDLFSVVPMDNYANHCAVVRQLTAKNLIKIESRRIYPTIEGSAYIKSLIVLFNKAKRKC